MYHTLESCNKIELKNPSKWNVQGYSKGGERTGFLVNPIKITLDAGVTTFIQPIASVITHSHCDHTLNLPTLYTCRKKTVKGQEQLYGRPIYMPQSCELPIQKLMEASILLSDNNPNVEKIDLSIKENIWKRQGYQPIIVKPNEKHKIYGTSNIYIEILKAYHNTETVGYGFYTTKRKLKDKYFNTSTQEKLEAKKNNIQIDYEIINYEFVYFCDSTIENLTLHDEWKKYPVVMCECTEFPERHSIDSRKHHTHLVNLEKIIRGNNNKQWILIHTSSSITKNVLESHQERLQKDKLDVIFA